MRKKLIFYNLIVLMICASIMFSLASFFSTTLRPPSQNIINEANIGYLNGSDITSTNYLNKTIGHVNINVNLTSRVNYKFHLSLLANCDFDMCLYNPSNVLLVNATRIGLGINESFEYFNPGANVTDRIQVSWRAGAGKFNVTVLTVPNITPPILYNYGVNKNNSNQAIIFTTYTFYTWYKDPDGYSPQQINMTINGTVYAMTRNATAMENYTAGVPFYVILPKLEKGTSFFNFKAWDGVGRNQSITMRVIVKKPTSILINATNKYSQGFNPNYNNDHAWTNTTNHNAWAISTSYYHSSPSSIGIQGAIISSYPYVENGTLISPLFDMTGNYQYMLTFDYRLYDGASSIETKVNMSGTWGNPILLGNISGVWQLDQQNMSQYKGSYVQFRFTFTGVTGTNLYLDDFLLQTFIPGNVTILNPMLTPSSGNQYTVYDLDITYQETNNILPTTLYLSIWNGTTPNAWQVNFIQDNATDWTVSDGKQYHCDFQVFNINNPVLWVVGDRGTWCLSTKPYYVTIDQSEQLETASFPYNLDFENSSSTYYTINNYVLANTNFVGSSGANHYFTTGTFTGNPADTETSVQLGLVTPLIHMYSDVQVFMYFDTNVTIINGLTSTFSIEISKDNGSTWKNLKQFTAGFTGRVLLNLTSNENNTVCLRFLLDTSTNLGFISGTWIIDNISIYEVDTTPPSMTAINISPGQWIYGTITVNITVHDVGFGVDKVMILLDGQSINNITSFKDNVASIMLDTTKFSNGNHNLTIIVIDESGNQRAYTISVKIDNTPYLLYGIVLIVIVAAAIIGVIAIKKNIRHIRNIPQYLNKRIILKEVEPSKQIAEKILQITGIFRRITAAELARKLQLPSVNSGNVLGYLRFMLTASMIQGTLDEATGTFNRTYPEKMKAILTSKEGVILDYLSRNDSVELANLVRDLQLERINRETLEDFIMGLVTARKINCYFEGDTIIKETGPITKEKTAAIAPARAERMTEVPVKARKIVRAPSVTEQVKFKATLEDKEGSILEYLLINETVSFDDLISDIQLGGFDREAIEDFIIGLVNDGKLKCHFDGDIIINEASPIKKAKVATTTSPRSETKTEVPVNERKIKPAPSVTEQVKYKATLADKEGVILEYLSTNETVSFDDLTNELQLDDFDREAIEDFIVSLVNDGKLKCHFDGDSIVSEAIPVEKSKPSAIASELVTIADKKDELIELVASRKKISFSEIKDMLSLEESTDDIEDFLFNLIKSSEIKGIIEQDSFLAS